MDVEDMAVESVLVFPIWGADSGVRLDTAGRAHDGRGGGSVLNAQGQSSCTSEGGVDLVVVAAGGLVKASESGADNGGRTDTVGRAPQGHDDGGRDALHEQGRSTFQMQSLGEAAVDGQPRAQARRHLHHPDLWSNIRRRESVSDMEVWAWKRPRRGSIRREVVRMAVATNMQKARASRR